MTTAPQPLEPGLTETLAQFSRRLGVARSTITRAAQAGRLVLTADGRVSVLASLHSWHATRGTRDDMAALHAAARGGAIPVADAPSPQPTAQNAASGLLGAAAGIPQQPQQPTRAAQRPPLPIVQPGVPAAADAIDDDEPSDGGARAAQQADKLAWQNALLALQIALADGNRLDRAAVQAEAMGLGGTLRGAVERVIDQVAPRIAAASTDADRHRILAAEVATVRRQIRRELPQSLRRLRPARAGER